MINSISKQRKIGQQLLLVELIKSERPRHVFQGAIHPTTTSVIRLAHLDWDEAVKLSYYCMNLDGLALSCDIADKRMRAKKESENFAVFIAKFLHLFGARVPLSQYDGSEAYVKVEESIIEELVHRYTFYISPENYTHAELYDTICSYRDYIRSFVSQAVADGFDMDVIKKMSVDIMDIEHLV